MSGTLYIVATPIGNLNDMTPRAAATFGSVDFVAAEDTRVTLKLLNHLGLKKPLVCSDAGMPAISDPGEEIVRDALAQGIPVVPVPAASACVTALAVSGQDTSRFVFEGFLPVAAKPRKQRLESLAGETRTMIFYEAPHKLRSTLEDLEKTFGGQRSITLTRELTKLHEEIRKTTLAEACAYYQENAPRGEYVLVVAGGEAETTPQEQITLEQAAQAARRLMEEGMPPSAAAKKAAQGTAFSKSQVYRLLIKEDEE